MLWKFLTECSYCFFFIGGALSVEKNLPNEVREAQEKKLEGLRKQQEIHSRLAIERKIFLRDRKIKFFGNNLELNLP